MKKKRSRKYFEELVAESVQILAPGENIIAQHHHIDTFDTMFAQLWRLYKYRERYDLYRCFAEASTVLHTALSRVVTLYYEPQFVRLHQRVAQQQDSEYSEAITQEYQALRTVLQQKEKKYRRLGLILQVVSTVVLIFDVVASVVFVMMVTYMLNGVKSYYTEYRQIFVLIAIASFIKIVLDKFVVTPLVIRRGWSQYAKTLSSIKETLAKSEALGIVLRYDLDHRGDVGEILRRFHENLVRL